MKKYTFYLVAALTALLFSCQKEPITPVNSPTPAEEQLQVEEYVPRRSSVTENLKIVTFNVYGASKSELEDIRDNYFSGDENIICLQEVDDVGEVLDVFNSGPNHRNESSYSSYPYYSSAKNYADKKIFQPRPKNYVMILSKFPIIKQDAKLIQKDPGGDRWRRHGQYVKLKVNTSTNIDLFHYHNTYNWHKNGSEWEKKGMEAFRDWVKSKLGISNLSSRSNLFLAGDFNLKTHSHTTTILGSGLNYAYDWVDYVVSTTTSINSENWKDGAPISDHDLQWAEFNMSTNRSNALGKVVRVYEHSNFGGRMASFEYGNNPDITNTHALSGDIDFWNDRISSIRVAGGLQLSAWEHNSYNGQVYYWPQINNSGTLSSLGMNDRISSLSVTFR